MALKQHRMLGQHKMVKATASELPVHRSIVISGNLHVICETGNVGLSVNHIKASFCLIFKSII